MASLIQLPEPIPVLRNPFLVMHLGGWSDAGLAGEGAAAFLGARLSTRTIAAFDPDELLDYRARRPVVRLANGIIEQLTWSAIELSVAETAGTRDVVMLTGPEPDFRWQAFTGEVVRACRALGVTEAFGLGGFPAPSVHTDPVQVLGSSVDPELAGRLDTVAAVVELSGGVQTVLEQRLYEAGIPATGIWARIPPYLAGGWAPPDRPLRRAAQSRHRRGGDRVSFWRRDRRRAGALPLPAAPARRRRPGLIGRFTPVASCRWC